MTSIALVHLVRAGNGSGEFARFLESLDTHPGGVAYDLVIIQKGFTDDSQELAECQALVADRPHRTLAIDDTGCDLTAYRYAQKTLAYDYYCFANSFTEFLDKDWLLKLYTHASREGVGLAGATASYQSPYSVILADSFRLRPERKRRFRSAPMAPSRNHVDNVRRHIGPYRSHYERYPAYHVRTNGFVVSRELLDRIDWPEIKDKQDAYHFESSRNSLTAQAIAQGFEPVVVGRDGVGYPRDEWPESHTFWRGDMANLLVADSRTHDYTKGDPDRRQELDNHAWIDPMQWRHPRAADPTEQCPMCVEGIVRKALTTRDYNRLLGDETFQYYRCTRCHYFYLHPPPANLASFYRDDYHLLPKTLDGDFISEAEELEAYKVELAKQYVKEGRYLEIGPSLGKALYIAKREGYDVEAIEMDAECCEFIRDQLGIPVTESPDARAVLEQTQKQYDVIAMWHVAEHLPNYLDTLEAAAGHLAPGGILIVASPNPDSVQFRILGEYWAHLDAPRHLCLIPLPLLLTQAATMGLHTEYASTHPPIQYTNFGWQYGWKNRFRARGLSEKAATDRAIRWTARCKRLFHRWESEGEGGCAYTAVFRRPLDD